MIISADPAIDQFVKDNLLLVGGTALTVFTAGCAVGRFVFDRLFATLRAEAEGFKNQRDEARRQRQEARLKVEHGDNGSDLQVKANNEVSLAKATGRFLSAITTILLLSLVGYSLYLQTSNQRGRLWNRLAMLSSENTLKQPFEHYKQNQMHQWCHHRS